MRIWDTANMEKSGPLTPSYFRNADAVILVYKCKDRDTLVNLNQCWIKECTDNCKDNVLYFVVGTKTDDDPDSANIVTEQEAQTVLGESPIKIETFFQITKTNSMQCQGFVNSMVDCLVRDSNKVTGSNNNVTEPSNSTNNTEVNVPEPVVLSIKKNTPQSKTADSSNPENSASASPTSGENKSRKKCAC